MNRTTLKKAWETEAAFQVSNAQAMDDGEEQVLTLPNTVHDVEDLVDFLRIMDKACDDESGIRLDWDECCEIRLVRALTGAELRARSAREAEDTANDLRQANHARG
jgi:hypothetical protein